MAQLRESNSNSTPADCCHETLGSEFTECPVFFSRSHRSVFRQKCLNLKIWVINSSARVLTQHCTFQTKYISGPKSAFVPTVCDSIIIKIRNNQHHTSSLSFTRLKGKKKKKSAKRYAAVWSTLVSLNYRGLSLIYLGSESRVPGCSASRLAIRYVCVNFFLKNHITTQPRSVGVSRVGVWASEVCTLPASDFSM